MNFPLHRIFLFLMPFLMTSTVGASDLDSLKVEANMLIAKAGESYDSGDIIGGLYWYDEALSVIGDVDSLHSVRVEVYESYMYYLLKTGNYEEALGYARAIIEIIENPAYTARRKYVYHTAGKILLKLNLQDMAIAIERRGLDYLLSRPAEDWFIGEREVRNELGLTYSHVGRYHEAIKQFKISLTKELNDHYGFVLNENIAEALIKGGHKQEARMLLDSMRTAKGRNEHIRRDINYLLLESEIALLDEDVQQAQVYVVQAKTVLENSSERHDQALWHRWFKAKERLLILRKDQSALMAHHREMETYQDSVNLIKTRALNYIRKSYYRKELENKDLLLQNSELELANEQALSAQQQAEASKQLLWVFIIAITIIAVLLGVLLMVRKHKEQERLRAEQAVHKANELRRDKSQLKNTLDHKERDIAALSHYLKGNNEYVDDLKSMLRRVHRIPNQTERENVMLNFISEARAKVHLRESNELATLQTKRIHSDLKAKLNDRHPALSKGQVALCLLIASGLGNSEIALQQNTTSKSVKTAKYRLKKKLGLEAEQDVYVYLTSL